MSDCVDLFIVGCDESKVYLSSDTQSHRIAAEMSANQKIKVKEEPDEEFDIYAGMPRYSSNLFFDSSLTSISHSCLTLLYNSPYLSPGRI